MTITDRIDNITKIPEIRRVPNPPCPRSVKIELTARCNFACSFCARSHMLRDQRDMDKSLYERLLLELKEEGVEEIGLFYLGESLLCSWLPWAIFYAKEVVEFPYVFLTTNGSLADKEKVQSLIWSGLDSLKWSLNYSDEVQFSKVAGVKPSLYRAMRRNIKDAKEVRDKHEQSTNHHCGLYASYIIYDNDQRSKMMKTVEEVHPYVDEIYELPLYNQAGLVTKEEQELGFIPTAGNQGRVGALRDPLPCWACFTEGHITYDGNLSACCFDHDGRFHMGDLKEQSFMQAWQSQEFVDLRSAHLKKDVKGTVCEGCIAYD